MEGQDWTPVVLGGRRTTKQIQERNKTSTEGQRLASLEKRIDNNESIVKKHTDPESIRALIKVRIDKKLTQDAADKLCGFPRHTFREIEAGRLIPNTKQLGVIQRFLGIAIRTIKDQS